MGLADLVQGFISASVALGWSILVAESLGYVVNIIAAYGRPCAVADTLNLPKYVVPIAGLLVGKPAGELPPVTPRAPIGASVGLDGYGSVDEKSEYYAKTVEGFVDKVARVLRPGGPVDRMEKEIRECYEARGFKI